jgi:hypothetical protein
MTLDYTICSQVNISMFDYVNEIINTFDKAEPKGGSTKSSAVPDDLFKVNKDREKLQPENAVEFHILVAKMLYATKRAKPDTCTAIAFLIMRVQVPNKDDWSKLVHQMKYPRGAHMLPLIISANRTSILKWWVDAAFAVHPNIQGGGLSLGRGFPIMSLTKQKLNTQSSMESEIVGADDFMLVICWTQYFMEDQGYQVQDNVLFQHNKSAIV